MKHAAAFSLFFVPLWWFWQVISGEWSRDEWIAGAAAACVAAVLAEVAVSLADGRAAVPRKILLAVPSALAMVFVDFAIVLAALPRRRRGVMRETTFKHPDDKRHRTWAAIVGDWSPNAYIVDIDDGLTVSHHIVRRDASQRPA